MASLQLDIERCNWGGVRYCMYLVGGQAGTPTGPLVSLLSRGKLACVKIFCPLSVQFRCTAACSGELPLKLMHAVLPPCLLSTICNVRCACCMLYRVIQHRPIKCALPKRSEWIGCMGCRDPSGATTTPTWRRSSPLSKMQEWICRVGQRRNMRMDNHQRQRSSPGGHSKQSPPP